MSDSYGKDRVTFWLLVFVVLACLVAAFCAGLGVAPSLVNGCQKHPDQQQSVQVTGHRP